MDRPLWINISLDSLHHGTWCLLVSSYGINKSSGMPVLHAPGIIMGNGELIWGRVRSRSWSRLWKYYVARVIQGLCFLLW
ncbi:hypothetical protein VN97_g4558 [Penicillium thymicola]|uniref:Uncharacterized protein n=1 Tax=Penicillium thymicola TaxID=293382 RepID=A0AAI9TKD0_PENTH|nr:hypothetical protein VN97_g4558 [Penicillium thymicola]